MAGVRIRYQSYGSPGDVEIIDCSVPETTAKFKEAAKAAKEEFAFVEITPKDTSLGKRLINASLVQDVLSL